MRRKRRPRRNPSKLAEVLDYYRSFPADFLTDPRWQGPDEHDRLRAVWDGIVRKLSGDEKEDLARLIRALGRRLPLMCYLTEGVEPDEREENAESRKAVRRRLRTIDARLEERWRLTGDRLAHSPRAPSRYLRKGRIVESGDDPEEVRSAPRRLKAGDIEKAVRGKARSLRLLFTRRQHQQFRLLKYLHDMTGRWHLRDSVMLLSAVYEYRDIPEEQYPTEDALHHLVQRFKANRRRWEKARRR
jgi:hypothetical protein